MWRNDEELRGSSHKNWGGGGLYIKQKAYGDGEFILQYLRSIL
jgi:hypothetical protein